MQTFKTIQDLAVPVIKMLSTDKLHAFRASLPVDEKDFPLEVGEIQAALLAAMQASNAQLLQSINALQAQIALMIPLSEKGVPLGVTPLDANGYVPAAFLNIIGAAFQGKWDATTNTPTLVDGTGTAGRWWLVENGTTRNLGAGSENWLNGSMIIYDGTKHVQNGALSTIIINGIASNTFTLDLSDIPDAPDRNAVTDAQKAALAGSWGIPGPGNEYITKTDPILTGGVIAVGQTAMTPELFEYNGINSGSGALVMLASLGAGLTNAQAQAIWPKTFARWGSIDVNNTSYADVVHQEMWENIALGSNYYRMATMPENRVYCFYRGGIVLPNMKIGIAANRDSQQFGIRGNHALLVNASGIARDGIYVKDPGNQTTADNASIDQMWDIEDLSFLGNGSAGDVGLKFGACRNLDMQGVFFKNFDKGMVGGFLLNSYFRKVNTSSCATAGLAFDKGWWTGAGYGNSVNQPTFERCRWRTTSGTSKGVSLINCDTMSVDNCQVEGTNGAYGIYIEVPSSATVVKNFEIRNLRSEVGGGNRYQNAIVGFNGREGYTLEINKVFTQDASATDSILLEATNTQGVTNFNVYNVRGNTGGNTWRFKNINNTGRGVYRFENTHLQGKPTTRNEVVDTVLFPNIWAAGSDIPAFGDIYIEPLLD